MARPTSTWRAALFSTSNNASPYSAAPTWTPAANSLIVCFVCTNATTAVDPSSVSAHGVSLTKILGGITADAAHMLSIWVGDAGSSPSSAAASATVAGSPTGCVVDEFEITNWGNSVSAVAAILQTNSGTGSAASGTVAVRLVPQTVNESGYLSFYIHVTNETSTGQGGNWTATAGGTGNYNTPATSAIGQHNNTGYTATATASWSTSSAYATIVIEVQGSTSATPSESLKIADTVTVLLNPEQANLNSAENVHVVDTLTQPVLQGGDLSRQVSPDEALKVQDAVTVDLPLQPGLLIETLRLDDQPPFVWERLKLSDSVSAALRTDLDRLVTAESLKVVDTLTPPQLTGDLISVAVTSEGLRVNDQPPFIEERLKVQDTVTAALATGNDLTRNVGDENLHVVDSSPDLTFGIYEILKVQDQTPLVNLGDLSVQVSPAESLKVVDTVTVFENPFFVTVAVENVKVQDSVTTSEDPLQTSTPAESLKVQDSVAVFENPLFAPVTDEPVKVADSVTLLENPLFAAPAVDSLKVQDQTPPSVSRIDGSDLNPPALTENVKIADTVTPSENPLFGAVGDEALKVQDSTTVVEDPLVAAPAVESLKVQDSVTLLENPLFASIVDEGLKVQDQTPPQASLTSANLLAATITPDEILHVQDSATLTLDPEQTAITTESLKISDTVTPALERSVTVTQEALKVQDTVTPALWLASSTPSEGLKVQDSLSASLTVLRASLTTESLKVQDQVNIGVDLLSVNIASENLKVQDFWIVEGTADYVVVIPADDYVVVIPKDDDAVVMP